MMMMIILVGLATKNSEQGFDTAIIVTMKMYHKKKEKAKE